MSGTVAGASWRYCDSCDRDTGDFIDISSNAVPDTSYPRIDRIAVVYDINNGVYDLTLLNFNGQTDVGIYFCSIVIRNYADFSYYFTMEFADGPSTASITGNVPVFADDSSSLTLTCAATANPGVTFLWINDNKIIGYSNTLTLSPTREDNGVNITCTAMNREYDDIWASISVTLEVYYGPSSVSIAGNDPVYDNDANMLALTCTAKDYNPDVVFLWKEGNQNINVQNTNKYTKIADKTDNGRTIKCLAWNSLYPSKIKETSAQMTVYYGPHNTDIFISALNPREGDDVTVLCTCDCNPDPSFTITGPAGDTHSKNRLYLENIFRADSGTYACTAGNEYGTQTKAIAILVIYAPGITVTLPLVVSEGERGVELLCEANGIPDSYNFGKWRHLGPIDYIEVRKLDGTHIGNQSVLVFDKPLTYEDSGYYECTVNNGVFDKTEKLDQSIRKYLHVTGPPHILEKEDSVHGDLGYAVNIEVRFYSVPEYTSVNWYLLDGSHLAVSQNNITIQGTDRLETTFHGHSVSVSGYITTLTFDNVKASDFVSFRVVVSNTEGSASFVKTLNGITWPDMPTEFRIATITSTSVSVTWSSGDNGGASQVFRVQHRETLIDGTDNRWQTHAVPEIPNSRTYTEEITNLTPDTIYDLRMYSKNEEGESDKTSTYVVKTETLVNPRLQDDSLVGVVVGSVIGFIVFIMVLVTGFLWKRRVLKVSWNNKKKKDDPSHVYQNSSFSAVVEDAASDERENAYQPIGPTENPNMHYQTLDSITTTDRVEPTDTVQDKTYRNA